MLQWLRLFFEACAQPYDRQRVFRPSIANFACSSIVRHLGFASYLSASASAAMGLISHGPAWPHDQSSLPIKARENLLIRSIVFLVAFSCSLQGHLQPSPFLLSVLSARAQGQEGLPPAGRDPCGLLTPIASHGTCAVYGAESPQFIAA
jgi:hypothetical protein